MVVPANAIELERRLPSELGRVRVDGAGADVTARDGWAQWGDERLFEVSSLQLLGRHNLGNALLAAAGARAFGAAPPGSRPARRRFARSRTGSRPSPSEPTGSGS